MTKAIQFNYEGVDYTLSFTRSSIKQMERNGFNIGAVSEMPLTTIENLFAGAFIAHHPRIKSEKIREIWTKLGDKQKIVEVLVELYNAPMDALFDEPEDDEKKLNWTEAV